MLPCTNAAVPCCAVQLPPGQRVTGLSLLARRVLQSIVDVHAVAGAQGVELLTIVLMVDSTQVRVLHCTVLCCGMPRCAVLCRTRAVEQWACPTHCRSLRCDVP